MPECFDGLPSLEQSLDSTARLPEGLFGLAMHTMARVPLNGCTAYIKNVDV